MARTQPNADDFNFPKCSFGADAEKDAEKLEAHIGAKTTLTADDVPLAAKPVKAAKPEAARPEGAKPDEWPRKGDN
jgi:hypothetical protein